VFAPLVTPRMKESLNTAHEGIDPTQVRAFVEGTPMACERKVIDIIRTAMLPSNHMFDVMYEFAIVLVKPAILASLSSPVTDELPASGIHR